MRSTTTYWPLAPNGGQRLDDTKRPFFAAQTTALAAVLDHDDVLVAGWRGLVRACEDIDNARYRNERIAFMRDTLLGLSECRKQIAGISALSPLPCRCWSAISSACSRRRRWSATWVWVD